MFEIIVWCSLAALIIYVPYLIFMLIRIEVVYRNLTKIVNAMHAYNMLQLKNGNVADILNYSRDIESYDDSLKRLWDFGYKNMVSKEVLEKIEPFIEKR